jgi:2-polyprenyl-3-methyl-5-hydroxy-6-metoxy-1,4-benzoquinol methylase
MTSKEEIFAKFLELKESFPFGPTYIEDRFPKYLGIACLLIEACPRPAQILSIGSGPCDLEAILSQLGFQITAVDDLNDAWHLIGKNQERIRDFAEEMNIELLQESVDSLQLGSEVFDAVLLIDVIEHLHGSPRELLNSSVSFLKPHGLLVIETPNAVALGKRLKVLFGKSGQADAKFVYWNVGEYRGHVREYTGSELKMILSNHKLTDIELQMANVHEEALLKTVRVYESAFKGAIKALYRISTSLLPGFKDTIRISARKPQNWGPTRPSMRQYKRYYKHIEMFNLDGESDKDIACKITD